MSVIISNLKLYGCASMPEADGATVGGVVDFNRKVTFSDLAANGTLDVVSSSASDTATRCIARFRDATGVVVTPAFVTLTGTTAVQISATNAERIQAVVISGGSIAGIADPGGTNAVGDVCVHANTRVLSSRTAQAGAAETASLPASITLQSGDGASCSVGMIIRILNNTPSGVQFQLREIVALSGDVAYVNRDWGTVPSSSTTYEVLRGVLCDILPQPIRAVTRMFATSAADALGGSSRTFYEKFFLSNQNATPLSLTGASVAIQAISPALPSGAALQIATCSAFNDNATAANRQTLPTNQGGGALTFTAGAPPQSQSVSAGGGAIPGGGTAANALGVWASLLLPAGAAAYKGAATIRAQGQTV